jgi:hypothetical protein
MLARQSICDDVVLPTDMKPRRSVLEWMSFSTTHNSSALYGSEARKELKIDTVLELLVKMARRCGGDDRECPFKSSAECECLCEKYSRSRCGNGDVREKPCAMSWGVETKHGG